MDSQLHSTSYQPANKIAPSRIGPVSAPALTIDLESEPNNTLANASLLTLTGTSQGQLSTLTDVDWYKAIPTQAGALLISFSDYIDFSSSGSHLYQIDVTDANGTVIDSFNYSNSSGNETHTWEIGVASTAAHYVRVSHNPASGALDTGLYHLEVNQASPTLDYEVEFNDTRQTANTIALNRKVEGRLSAWHEQQSPATNVDWYRVVPSQAGALEISFTDYINFRSDGSHLYKIDVTDINGNVLDSFNYNDGTGFYTWHVGVASTAATFIKVSHDAASGALDSGYYNLLVTQANTDKDYEVEYNDTRATANTIALGRTVEGQLSASHEGSASGNVDWFKVVPAAAGALEIRFTDYINFSSSGSHLYKIELTNSNGTVLESINYNTGDSAYTWRVGVASTAPHYIKISHDPATGALDTGWYNLTVNQANNSIDYEYEYNDSRETATPIALNRTVEGYLSAYHEQVSPSNNVDWYKVVPSVAGALEVTFTDYINFSSSGSHLYKVDITDSNGNVLESFNYNTGNRAYTWHVGVANTQAYYIKVSHDPASGPIDTGLYNLSVSQAATNKDYEPKTTTRCKMPIRWCWAAPSKANCQHRTKHNQRPVMWIGIR